jgi:sugar transferase (PEP-CTERM/EpsH1 system associated)
VRDLLYLCHRIPYPPNKGDKIRSFHLLRYLTQHYRVHLGCFIDDADDWAHRATLEQMCASTCFVGLDKRWATLKSAQGLLTGEALSLPYYASPRLQAYADAVTRQHTVERVVVFSSTMAQFVGPDLRQRARVVVDFVDVDSDKWRQYAASKRWPMSALYRREAQRLGVYEAHVASWASASVLVSAQEAALFQQLVPSCATKTTFFENGVDTVYFDPTLDLPNPYPPGASVMVFTGAMDYWANVDAVVWFAQEVLPRIRTQHGEAQFYIVGSRPAEAVKQLANLPGVTVTGSVPDVRPYLKFAQCAVAPLRIARGIQNKVLEALAMAKPVLATSMAAEGIRFDEAFTIHIVDEPADMATQALRWLTAADDLATVGARGRAFVLQSYGWDAKLARVGQLLEETS